MFRVQCDHTKQLLAIRYTGQVEPGEMPACVHRVGLCLKAMTPGFRLLADFSGMERMDPACGTLLAEIMDRCSAAGVEFIYRVVPDPRKDIGLNILSFFHYGPEVRILTYETLEQAVEALGNE